MIVIILILSFLLRFYQLDTIPASLNPDEKFNGYLSYSLLHTAKDERGNLLPVSIQTFGNWTLIGYAAVDILPIALLGLNEISVRLPAALCGVISVGLIYLIALKLFKNKKSALLSALFLALSPWSIFLSRISHETTLGFTLFLAGLFFLLDKKMLIAAVFFGLSLLTHYAYIIFVPLFVGGYILLKLKEIKLNKRSLIAGAIFSLFALLVVSTIFKGGINQLNYDTGVFGNEGIIYWRADRFKVDSAHTVGDFLINFHNKFTGLAYELGQNYAGVYSPAFLFDKGGETLMHNTGYTGNLYLVDLALVLAGFGFLLWERNPNIFVLLLWAIVGPLTSIFTKDSPSTSRLYPLVGMFALASGYGALKLTTMFPRFKKVVVLVIAVALVFCVTWFLDAYFVHLNIQRARFLNFGYKEAALAAQKYPEDKIVVVGPENFAYISFLFYNQYDPNKFRNEVSYYPQKTNGFQYVKSFGRFNFVEKIDRSKAEDNTLYIDYSCQDCDKRNVIRLPGGEPLFTYFTKKDLINGEVK